MFRIATATSYKKTAKYEITFHEKKKTQHFYDHHEMLIHFWFALEIL